jgi:hypothetical protein
MERVSLVMKMIRLFFELSQLLEIGDGRKTIFWQDRWIDRMVSMDLASNLYKKAHFNKRTVLMELSNKSWMHTTQYISSKDELLEFINL